MICWPLKNVKSEHKCLVHSCYNQCSGDLILFVWEKWSILLSSRSQTPPPSPAPFSGPALWLFRGFPLVKSWSKTTSQKKINPFTCWFFRMSNLKDLKNLIEKLICLTFQAYFLSLDLELKQKSKSSLVYVWVMF